MYTSTFFENLNFENKLFTIYVMQVSILTGYFLLKIKTLIAIIKVTGTKLIKTKQ